MKVCEIEVNPLGRSNRKAVLKIWMHVMSGPARTDWDSRRSAELLLLQERANATLSTSGGISLPTAAAALKETNSVHQLGP